MTEETDRFGTKDTLLVNGVEISGARRNPRKDTGGIGKTRLYLHFSTVLERETDQEPGHFSCAENHSVNLRTR